MKATVNVFERGPRKAARKIASFEVEGATIDELGAAARSKLSARVVVGLSHGPRAITAYVAPR